MIVTVLMQVIYLFISALTLTTPATQIKQQNASQG